MVDTVLDSKQLKTVLFRNTIFVIRCRYFSYHPWLFDLQAATSYLKFAGFVSLLLKLFGHILEVLFAVGIIFLSLLIIFVFLSDEVNHRLNFSILLLQHISIDEFLSSINQILPNFSELLHSNSLSPHQSETSLNRVGERHSEVIEHQTSSSVLLVLANYVRALLDAEILVFSRKQLRKHFAD